MNPRPSFLREFFRPAIRDAIRPGQWSPSVQAMAAVSGLTALVAVAFTLAAGSIRSWSDPVLLGANAYLPEIALPLATSGSFLAMTLLQVAALHVGWPIRITALLVATAVALLVGSQTNSWATMGLGLASVVGLVVLHVVRARRSYAWGEVPIVAVLVFLITVAPMYGASQGISLGYDLRGILLNAQLTLLMVLALPSLIVAGVALTQVAVIAGEAAGMVAAERLSPRMGQVALAVILVGLCGWRVWAIVTSGSLDMPGRLAAGLGVLAATVTLASPMIQRAFRCGGSHRLLLGGITEQFSRLSFGLALGLAGWLVLTTSTTSLVVPILSLTGRDPAWLFPLIDMAAAWWAPYATRIVPGVLALVLAWRWAGQGRWVPSLLVAGFLVPQVAALGRQLVPGLPDMSDTGALAAWLVLALLITTAWCASRNPIQGAPLRWLLTAAAILAIYELRHILDNPLGLLVGFSSSAVVLFGLLWRAVTDGEFTRGTSRWLPTTSRVFLYLANFVLAFTVLAVSTISGSYSTVDVATWEDLGDSAFAPTLLVTAVLAALASAVLEARDQAGGQFIQRRDHAHVG
ncbi:MAG: hypothetical protein ACK5KO_00375 [Arachnia sp.]